MQIFTGSGGIVDSVGPYAVAIGNFDGIHVGHQALLEEVLRRGRKDQLPTLAYTFHPHPATVLSKADGPLLIEPLELRIERLADKGFDATLIEPFDVEFATVTAEDFVGDILHQKLRAKHVVVGEDFSFGHRAQGNTKMLTEMGEALGFETASIPFVTREGEPVSSTRVRKAVQNGDVTLASCLLGRSFSVTGLVMRGHQRGSDIGFPTANVATYHELLPREGVYAARVGGEFEGAAAVVNIGYAPTFDRLDLRLEVHILDFESRPLYGRMMEIHFIERMRDEQHFPSQESLATQIAKDIQRARELLA